MALGLLIEWLMDPNWKIGKPNLKKVRVKEYVWCGLALYQTGSTNMVT